MYNLSEIKKYIARDRPDGVILDTNILILLLVGKYDQNFIEECGLTSGGDYQYTKEDFGLLVSILSFFKKIVITPHVIAELSNLSKKELRDKKLNQYFCSCINFLKSPLLEERHFKLSSLLGVDIKLISNFGFTDMAMLELSKETKMPILTDDGPFYSYSCGKTPVIKFSIVKNYPLTAKLYE